MNSLLSKLGYEYQNDELVALALSHRSVGANNNERLEFLGDSILNYIIAEALFHQFPRAKEGQLSQMRAQLVKGATLAEIAREFNLGDHVRLGPGEMKSGGHRRESILADVVEALIGAMYIDGGMDITRECVLSWYTDRLEKISPQDKANKDAKSQLQEYLQSIKLPLPTYHLINTTGSDHQQYFEVECEVANSNERFLGAGSNRRSAEQAAAKAALDALQSR